MEKKAEKLGIIYKSPILTWKNEKHFIVPEVIYRGKTGTYGIFERMTSAMNQEQLAEFYEREKQKGNPHPADAPLIWAIATKGYELRNKNPKNAEKLRKLLKNGFREYQNTLTRIIFNNSGTDEIIHNYKTSEQYSIKDKVIGPDGFIDKVSNANILEQILGTKDITKINKVSQGINSTNIHIWRLNSKPDVREEGTVGFGANKERFNLNCYRAISDNNPAFRILKFD
jgi:hypothetical protein